MIERALSGKAEDRSPPCVPHSSRCARSLLLKARIVRKQMLDSARIAELVRQLDEIEQAFVACPADKQELKDLERHHGQLKKQIEWLQHEAAAHRLTQ